MVELMSNHVSSPVWMGVLTLISLVIMVIGVPAMYLMNDDAKSDRIRYFVFAVTLLFVGFIFYGAIQQQGNLKEKNFTVVRYGDELYVTSETPWLQSKNLLFIAKMMNTFISKIKNSMKSRRANINKGELYGRH